MVTWIKDNSTIVEISFSTKHTIDIDGYWKYHFTPYAAFDPEIKKSGKMPIQIGNNESEAQLIKRSLQRIELLQLLTPGIELKNDQFHAVTYNSTKLQTTIIWDTRTLHYHIASKADMLDFPHYLEKAYYLERKTAWILAWVLVRASYLDEQKIVTQALNLANHSKANKGNDIKLALDALSAKLKRLSL